MGICCFTGHRPNKLGGYDWKDSKNIAIGKALRSEILKLIEIGVDTFVCGGAIGVDQMAFAVVDKLRREKGLALKIILAVPFENQYIKWNTTDRALYFNQKDIADSIVYCDQLKETKYYCDLNGVGNYHPAKMQKRNEYMVDISDFVIAVWDGTSGGTCNCVKYAEKLKKQIIKINPKEIL